MSNVQQVQQNIQSQQNVQLKPAKQYAPRMQSFKGEADSFQSVAKNLTNSQSFFVRQLVKFSKFFAKHDGELQSQSINAAFTTTLAPFFIAYNPLSDQDEKTKKYTALRQPISAGIAISGGLMMTKAINGFMKRLGNDGFVPTTDGRLTPSAKSLKGEFQEAFNAAENKEKFLNDCKPIFDDSKAKFLSDNVTPTEDFRKACLEGYTKKAQEHRINLFSHLATEKPENLSIKDGVISVMKDGKSKVIGKNIPNLTTTEELTDYVNANNIHKKTFGDFMQKHFGFEFYPTEEGKTAELKPSSIEKRLPEASAMDFLNKIGITGEGTNIKDRKAASGSTLGKILTGSDKNDLSKMNLEQFLAKAGLISERNDEVSISGSVKKETEEMQELMKKPLNEILTTFENKIKANVKDVPNFKNDANVLDFTKNVISNMAKTQPTRFKTLTNYTGIFFNLFTTAITCTVLNWAYPRIVEKFWPELVKPSAKPADNNGGNK